MYKKIICLDFDGVIHSYTSGWQGPRNIPDEPVPGAIAFIANLIDKGYRVYIYSSRSKAWGGRRAMRKWLKHHSGALWYDYIEYVEFPLYKPPASVTIDDRAITFKGRFDTLIEEIETFRPWNKYNGVKN